MFKKILSFTLAIILCLSFISCDLLEEPDEETKEERTTKKQEETMTDEESSEEITTKKEEESSSESNERTDPPYLTYIYNTSESHKVIGEYLQAAMKSAGITMALQNQEWNTFLETRQNGEFSIARNGWLADFNDPITFLDLWTSESYGNDAQFGKGAHATLRMYNLDLTKYGYNIKVENGTWSQTYDRLISVIKDCKDKETRYALMHIAEDMIMDTGCIIPLYYYTDLYMISKDVEGFYSNPIGVKYFMNTKMIGRNDISVCLGGEPQSLDPALCSMVEDMSIVSHLFSGLAKWTEDENGNVVVVADVAEELVDPTVNADGTVTYTYTLKDTIWSNGDKVTAKDFAESWKRAASDELWADYGYMFEVIKGYYTGDLAVNAIDDKTLQVTLYSDIHYWNELLAFPTYFPVHKQNRSDENGLWATRSETYICNGPYTMDDWTHTIVLKKNPNYHDADTVTMERINFYLSDDSSSILANFQYGHWQFVDDVPTNRINDLKVNNSDEFNIKGQIGTYFACWNINENLLPESSLTGVELEKAQQEIRKAISLLIDRNFIVNDIAQGGQMPASSLVAMGVTDADGSEFYKNAGINNDFDGYYDVSPEAQKSNWEKAMEILTKYYNITVD